MEDRSRADALFDALLLRDGEGAVYALPVELVKQLRVPDGQRAPLEALFAEDTAGFAAGWELRSAVALGVGTAMEFDGQTVTVSLTGPSTEPQGRSGDATDRGARIEAGEPGGPLVVLIDEGQQFYAVSLDLVLRARVPGDRAEALRHALDRSEDRPSGPRFTAIVLPRSAAENG